MKIGPRYKICKRLGSSVYEKCQTQKFTISESRKKIQRKGRRPRMMSDYGKQLIEKQRMRLTYGLTEKQLSRYVKISLGKKGISATEKLFELLETRLDNVVYRLGLVPTRRSARQLVSHGHVEVNGIKVTIPSYHVSVSDNITIREKSRSGGFFEDFAERSKEHTVPTWLTCNTKKIEGIVKSLPNRENTEAQFDTTVVMEYYSR